MRSIWCVLLVWAMLPLAPGASGAGPSKGELQLLKGQWELKKYVWGEKGKAVPRDILVPPKTHALLRLFQIEPGGSAARMDLFGEKGLMTFWRGVELVDRQVGVRLDAREVPGTIDLVFESTTGPKVAFRGIYKLEGGRLTLCFADDGGRPKEFKATQKQALLYFERRR